MAAQLAKINETHQQSVISLEILESPFFKKRWFLEHLELI